MKFSQDELDNIFEAIRLLNDMNFDYVSVDESIIDNVKNDKGEFIEGEKITLIFENYTKKRPGKFALRVKYGIEEDERD